jgi:excisionase family DNA binding protein
MAGAQILFPIEPDEFWRQMKSLVEEVINQKINSKSASVLAGKLTDKSLLKMTEVCELFQVTKPTIYQWVKQGKMKSIKIQARRYFLLQNIEELIKTMSTD